MRRFQGFGPLIAVTIIGLCLVIFAGSISRWVASNRAAYNGALIGHIVHAEGSTRRIHSGNIDVLPSGLPAPVDLRDGDRIQTSVDSKAIVVLNSQDEFEVTPGSSVQFHLGNPKDPGSPIYANPMLGQLILRKPGVHGKAYVIKEGKLYLPAQTPLEKPMALTVLRTAPLDMHLAGDTAKAPDLEESTNISDAPAVVPASEPETLSNEYIDDTIVGRQAQFQKCWLTRLKDAPKLKGKMVMQFEISRRGQVKNARVGESSITDEVLQRCVISVIERIPFRSYRGAEISLSYPINFE